MDMEDNNISCKKISQQGVDVCYKFWPFRQLFISPRLPVP